MALREDLDTAIENSMFAGTYQRRIEDLRRAHGHAITILPCDDIQRFNCYAFATGVSGLPGYATLVDRRQNSALLNSTFVGQLIADGVLQLSDVAVPGGVAVYFDGDRITHAARVLDTTERLSSKWGPSDLHEHGLWEVPATYGNAVKFFSPPDGDAILQRLEASLVD